MVIPDSVCCFYKIYSLLDNYIEAANWGVLWEKVFLEILWNSQENTYARVFFCEFCKISKYTFFIEHFPVATSD